MTDDPDPSSAVWAAVRVGVEDLMPRGWCAHRHRMMGRAEECARRLGPSGPDDEMWVVVNFPADRSGPYLLRPAKETQ